MFFKNHVAQVKLVKEKPGEDMEHPPSYILTPNDVTRVVDEAVSAIVVACVMYKASTTFFRIVEHVVVTKVK